MTKRIAWIDVAKGILICFVIVGHSDISAITGVIINSFHMIAFFMLSGFTFSDKRNFKDFTLRKAKSILIPYLEFSTILLLYQFLRSTLLHSGKFDLISGLLSIVLPVSGRETTTVYGLWFLPCLFLAEISVYIIVKISRKRKTGSVFVFLGLCVAAFVIYHFTKQASIITILPIAALAILTGCILKKYVESIEKNKVLIMFGSLVVFAGAVTLNYMYSKHSFDLSSLSVGILGLYILSGIAGSLFIICISMILKNTKLVALLGKDSLYYYGLHYPVLGLVSHLVPIGFLQAVITIAILCPIIMIFKKLEFWKGK